MPPNSRLDSGRPKLPNGGSRAIWGGFGSKSTKLAGSVNFSSGFNRHLTKTRLNHAPQICETSLGEIAHSGSLDTALCSTVLPVCIAYQRTQERQLVDL